MLVVESPIDTGKGLTRDPTPIFKSAGPLDFSTAIVRLVPPFSAERQDGRNATGTALAMPLAIWLGARKSATTSTGGTNRLNVQLEAVNVGLECAVEDGALYGDGISGPGSGSLVFSCVGGAGAFTRRLDPAWPMLVGSMRVRFVGEAYFFKPFGGVAGRLKPVFRRTSWLEPDDGAGRVAAAEGKGEAELEKRLEGWRLSKTEGRSRSWTARRSVG